MTFYYSESLRQIEILSQILNGKVCSKADLAEEYNVTEITINRYLRVLRKLGVQIFSKKNRVVLTSEPNSEVLSRLAAEYISLKLNSEMHYKKLKVLSQHLKQNTLPWLTLLSKAVAEHKVITIKYQRLYDNQIEAYDLCPIQLINNDFNWLLQARKVDDNIVRTFYINRIIEIHQKEKSFQPIHLDEKEENVHQIVLRFHPDVEQQVLCKIWFDDFEAEKDKDGFIVIKTNQPITNKLASWCISWWDMIEILSPKELIEHTISMISEFKEKNR
jgi:predicted DNA-binding transcriptional regulator YafY